MFLCLPKEKKKLEKTHAQGVFQNKKIKIRKTQTMRRSLSETDVQLKSIRGGEAPHRAERPERGGEGESETADVRSSATRLFQSRTPNISLKQMDPLASTTFLNKESGRGKKKESISGPASHATSFFWQTVSRAVPLPINFASVLGSIKREGERKKLCLEEEESAGRSSSPALI